MTAASALEGRSADARLNACPAALSGAAAGWTLWMGNCWCAPWEFVRTWRFDPREVVAPSDPARTGNSDSATPAGVHAHDSAQARRRPVRYTLIFALVFCAVYLPAVVLTRWGGIGGAVLLPAIAAVAAWYVAHSRPAVPDSEGFGASICAAALAATVAASCCSAVAWLQVFAISVTGPASSGSEADFAGLFAQAWVGAWLSVGGVQYMRSWMAAGSAAHTK